jgi:RNase P subunit RPR2
MSRLIKEGEKLRDGEREIYCSVCRRKFAFTESDLFTLQSRNHYNSVIREVVTHCPNCNRKNRFSEFGLV